MALIQRVTHSESIRLLLAGRVVFCLAFNLVTLSPEAGWCQETVILSGQVRGSDGRTIPSGVNLRLETAQGMLVQTQPATAGGLFEFTDLHKQPYRLTVTAEGFQTLQQDLDLSFSANRVFINLFLTSAGESKSEKVAPPALTDQQATRKAREEFAKGVQAFSKEKYSEARARFEKAITECPCYARAQTQLAITLIDLSDPTHAESAARKSIECDPGFSEARLVLGQLLNMQKRFDESEQVLREAVRLAPGSWHLHYQLGVAEFGLGKYAKAEQEYQEVLTLNPVPPPDYHVKVADVYLAEKAYDKAYAEMQTYLQTDPRGRFAEKIRRIIQQMETAGALSKPRPSPAQAKNE